MTAPRKPSLILPVAVVATLLAEYVGGYWYWLNSPFDPTQTAEEALVEHTQAMRFFAPIHWLDRRMRAHVWEPTP